MTARSERSQEAAMSSPMPDEFDNSALEGFDEFASWYTDGGEGSGPGSGVEYTSAYRAFLHEFFVQQSISSVLDFGCGDWTFSQYVDWPGLYIGVDIVPSLIERLRSTYARDNRVFDLIDARCPQLKRVDLIITKDVMQHLPDHDIIFYRSLFRRHARHILWVNGDWESGCDTNRPIRRGQYRGLRLNEAPFMFAGKVVFSYATTPKNLVFWESVEDQSTS